MDQSKFSLLLDLLEQGIELFKGKPRCDVALPSREKLQAVLEKIRVDTSKIGVLCQDGGSDLPLIQLEALAETLVQGCLSLAALLHCLTSGAGPSLKSVLQAAAASVLQPAGHLLKELFESGGGKAVKSSIGHVWGALESCEKVPFDNKSAIFKRIAVVLTSMQDGIREMDELSGGENKKMKIEEEEEEEHRAVHEIDEVRGKVSEQKTIDEVRGKVSEQKTIDEVRGKVSEQKNIDEVHNQTELGQRQVDDEEQRPSRALEVEVHVASAAKEKVEGAEDEEDAFEFESGELSEAEQRTLLCARKLVETAGRVLRCISKPLLQGPAVIQDADLDNWENVLWHSQAMQRCCENLGAGMYPPQSYDEVCGAAEGLYNSAALLLQEVPEACAAQIESDTSALEVMLEDCWVHLQAAMPTSDS
ncbi:hypothetical protein CEUSTIGMA_g4057.t1 [Chlamydomonas eustigma]|uniref:Cyclin-D1-binding protein 1-like N-terminal domain-containing protein n=1 Tax=Chlamydomonas eustigma TaxID=1157962 RepID=A0A250X0K6_9CHLO|nr:hypothetical protein CEUSTIGMA_g4057.t1 [Chlamydomonas eustigma]|eukprot:GAX76611.1 hypothetical protein CEUSTIGMA_g4057.t1 [Chlamydomonas eustigma]